MPGANTPSSLVIRMRMWRGSVCLEIEGIPRAVGRYGCSCERRPAGPMRPSPTIPVGIGCSGRRSTSPPHDPTPCDRRSAALRDHRRHRRPVGDRSWPSARRCHRGWRHAPFVHQGRPTRGGRVRAGRVEQGRPRPGARPVAEPTGRRALFVRRSGGPGTAGRAVEGERHPRPGALDAMANGGPGPEPGHDGLPAPPLAGVPLRLAAHHRVPVGEGRPHRGDRGRQPGPGRSPVRTRVPPVFDRRHGQRGQRSPAAFRPASG